MFLVFLPFWSFGGRPHLWALHQGQSCPENRVTHTMPSWVSFLRMVVYCYCTINKIPFKHMQIKCWKSQSLDTSRSFRNTNTHPPPHPILDPHPSPSGIAFAEGKMETQRHCFPPASAPSTNFDSNTRLGGAGAGSQPLEALHSLKALCCFFVRSPHNFSVFLFLRNKICAKCIKIWFNGFKSLESVLRRWCSISLGLLRS